MILVLVASTISFLFGYGVRSYVYLAHQEWGGKLLPPEITTQYIIAPETVKMLIEAIKNKGDGLPCLLDKNGTPWCFYGAGPEGLQCYHSDHKNFYSNKPKAFSAIEVKELFPDLKVIPLSENKETVAVSKEEYERLKKAQAHYNSASEELDQFLGKI